MKKSFIILFTSTISPGDYNFVGRKDVDCRLKDYLKAFNFYFDLGFKIFWIDNSGYDLSFLDTFSNVSYFSFLSTESYKGKGHGELEIMSKAFSSYENINDETIVIKISGRYIIENLEDLVSQFKDLENFHYCNFSRNFYWTDTRLLVLNRSFFYNFFQPTCNLFLNESLGILFEKAYARSIHLWMYNGGRVKLFSVPIFFDSYNGVTNKKIKFNLLIKLKYRIFILIKNWVFKQVI